MMDQGKTIEYSGKHYSAVDVSDISCWTQLPHTMRILLESLLRVHPDRRSEWIEVFESWITGERSSVSFYPSRVLMQDLTGVPALVDLTAMRDAMEALGGEPANINPNCSVDLVIDHSVTADFAKTPEAFEQNVALEVARNKERYALLKWSQNAFDHMQIVPPGKGICHQVNLEYLANVVTAKDGFLYPDSLVGLDSHTTMINGLGVLGWGVGGIEAEAAMLGQPISMNLPDVIGVCLHGDLKPGVTATDLVLTITERLRKVGVVSQFVEFYGQGAAELSLAERATVANMAPEFGATCAFFPVDEITLDYLKLTGRSSAHIAMVRQYMTHMQMMRNDQDDVQYTKVVNVNLGEVEPCIAGPHRPEQRLLLKDVKQSVADVVQSADRKKLSDASVVIAAITSCTNTSNPSVLIGAGLLAKKANDLGLKVPDWVKPSFAPGSRVVVDYLTQLDLMGELEKLGFYLVGFGCTTCIGNSGPLEKKIADSIDNESLVVSSVLSGNRNFEGRVHPQTQLNYLASPPLVVAYGIAGTVLIDFDTEPLGQHEGKDVFLRDIWPADKEIQQAMSAVSAEMFNREYQGIFEGTAEWDRILVENHDRFSWDDASTYIRKPGFFDEMKLEPNLPKDVSSARVLAILGDNVTTDHISPAGTIAQESAAAQYLAQKGVGPDALHSYGARRGNAEVMVRGTFANIRLANQMANGKLGGYTVYQPEGKEMMIYDAAMKYAAEDIPAVVFAGQRYGTGSSRDWAAKGTLLLGVRVVIAESFERIHRSNLIGMGVLPCIIQPEDRARLNIDGSELINIIGIEGMLKPAQKLTLQIDRNGRISEASVESAIVTDQELQYFQHGGILKYVLRQMH